MRNAVLFRCSRRWIQRMRLRALVLSSPLNSRRRVAYMVKRRTQSQLRPALSLISVRQSQHSSMRMCCQFRSFPSFLLHWRYPSHISIGQRRFDHSDSSTEGDSKSTPTTSTMINYFEMLGLEPKFNLSKDEIQRAFQTRMRTSHPDLHHTKGESSVADAEQAASRLNRARSVLESPLWRAQHYLMLEQDRRRRLDEDSGIADEMSEVIDGLSETTKISDPLFLGEIMEVRLEIEDWASQLNEKSDDSIGRTQAILELEKMLNDNAKKSERMIESIDECFQKGELSSVSDLLSRLIYYHRIEGEIKDVLPAKE